MGAWAIRRIGVNKPGAPDNIIHHCGSKMNRKVSFCGFVVYLLCERNYFHITIFFERSHPMWQTILKYGAAAIGGIVVGIVGTKVLTKKGKKEEPEASV